MPNLVRLDLQMLSDQSGNSPSCTDNFQLLRHYEVGKLLRNVNYHGWAQILPFAADSMEPGWVGLVGVGGGKYFFVKWCFDCFEKGVVGFDSPT